MLFDFLTNDLLESFFIPLIGLLLAMFLYKVISYVVRDPRDNSYRYNYLFDVIDDGSGTQEERDLRRANRKAEDNKVFTYSMFAGVIALILGAWGYLQSYRDPRISAPSRGVALGGFLLIFYNILINWSEFQEGVRIAVLGLSFLALTAAAFWMIRS